MMIKDIYVKLEGAKQNLLSLQKARDKVTAGFYSNSYERESALSEFLTETGKFNGDLDSTCDAVENALSSIFSLSERIEELENRVIELVEQKEGLA